LEDIAYEEYPYILFVYNISKALLVVRMEKYIACDEEKAKQVREIVSQIAGDNNKEYERKKADALINNFCNSDICKNIKDVNKKTVKDSAYEYCNKKMDEMEKRWFIPHINDYYPFIEIFGFDEEFKNKMRNSINKFLASTINI
jgi:hypothetical protein